MTTAFTQEVDGAYHWRLRIESQTGESVRSIYEKRVGLPMVTRIQVFLRSTTLPSHLAEFKDSYDLHYHWEIYHRDIYHWLREQGFSKGRSFKPDSAALLPVLEIALQRTSDRIAIYELNTLTGNVRGWLAGVRLTPSVLVDGQKHVGLAAARLALQRILDQPAAALDVPQ